jgi:hypothetical protein
MRSKLHHLILSGFLFGICGFATTSLLADQGIVLTREYADQKEQFWGFFVFKGSKESFASIKFTLANGEESIIPRHRVGMILRITDLNRLSLVTPSEKQEIELERDTLNIALGRFKQIETLIKPVIEKLDEALDDYTKGWVYVGGKRQEATALTAKTTPPVVAPAQDMIPSLEIDGIKYSNIKLSSIGINTITLSHSGGVVSMETSRFGDQNLALIKQKWPKQFEAKAAQQAKADYAMTQGGSLPLQSTAGYDASNMRLEPLNLLASRLRSIYGNVENEKLLALILAIAHEDTFPNPNTVAFTRLLTVTDRVINQAEAAARKFGGSLQHQIDVHAKMVPYLRQ